MEYFENIKRYRKEKEWTQQQLADELQVSRKTIVRWENGWNVPTLFYAQKMAKLFGITVGELMSDEDPSEEVATPVPGRKNSLIAPLIWFALLTFLPYFAVLFVSPYMESILSKEMFVNAAIFAYIMLGIWWILQLVGIFSCTEDKYGRFILYKQWRIGIFFLAMNLAFLFDFQMLNRYPWNGVIYDLGELNFLLIFGYISAGIFICILVDILLKRVLRKFMVVERNRILDGFNLAYLITSVAVPFIAWLFSLFRLFDLFYILFVVPFALMGIFIVTLLYLITIAILTLVQHRKKEE